MLKFSCESLISQTVCCSFRTAGLDNRAYETSYVQSVYGFENIIKREERMREMGGKDGIDKRALPKAKNGTVFSNSVES